MKANCSCGSYVVWHGQDFLDDGWKGECDKCGRKVTGSTREEVRGKLMESPDELPAKHLVDR